MVPQTALPTQPGGQDDLRGRDPVAPAASEATRLLCAGVYLDDGYRDAVIDELYVHEERIAAPSYGFDAARVLAHALRARRTELAWAAGVVALWVFAVPLTGGMFAVLMGPCLMLSLSGWLRGSSAQPPLYRLVPAFLLRWYGRILLAFVIVGLISAAFDSEDSGDSGYGGEYGGEYSGGGGFGGYGESSPFGSSDSFGIEELFSSVGGPGSDLPLGSAGTAWGILALFAVLTAVVAIRRGQFARILASELSPQQFPNHAADPAERGTGLRFGRLAQHIRVEQHAPLVMYNASQPFCGAGLPYQPWNLSVELRPRRDSTPEAIDNAKIINRIVPLVEALRVPSPHGSPQLAAAVRDRLRELRTDECVFLPVAGLTRRDQAPYDSTGFEAHRSGSVEEGGESRRHFLRIRVGGWSEEVVVTVFVRVHTQGGMLMLEVAPHVLLPVRQLFQDADRIAHRHRNNNWFGKAVWALTRTPRSFGSALAALGRGAISGWKMLTGGNGGALPDGPARSVRELGSDWDASLFQDMDINRYLKSVQDRVTGGVRLALHEAGWQTDEFEQKIVNVGSGGVFIESAHGSAIGIGDGNSVTNTNNNSSSKDGGARRGKA
ncbi:hypothetical protein [Streptomyces sp. ISL-96]|uniref:hypothetical protein n=1 Tax=Streptomyces sp. ISL-96 TaxID=2819191 RepID=UPI0020356341|nr:hypothetical protein [Streptomyces sp. ISL-96]